MDEIPVIWEIILQAKAQMYREGKHQWDENYPTVPILENDVRRGWGYVLVPSDDDSDIIAYGAVVFDGESAYSGLQDGQWLSGQPYVVAALRGTAPPGSGRPLETSGHGRPLHAGSLRPGPLPRHPKFQGRYQL